MDAPALVYDFNRRIPKVGSRFFNSLMALLYCRSECLLDSSGSGAGSPCSLLDLLRCYRAIFTENSKNQHPSKAEDHASNSQINEGGARCFVSFTTSTPNERTEGQDQLLFTRIPRHRNRVAISPTLRLDDVWSGIPHSFRDPCHEGEEKRHTDMLTVNRFDNSFRQPPPERIRRIIEYLRS